MKIKEKDYTIILKNGEKITIGFKIMTRLVQAFQEWGDAGAEELQQIIMDKKTDELNLIIDFNEVAAIV